MSDFEVVEDGPLPYLVSRPKAQGMHPVLFFLHGYDEGPPTPIEEGVTRHGPLAPTASPAATATAIVVAPQLPQKGDLWFRHPDDVETIVSRVQEQHGGDPDRTYLTGFSFGGNGVFDLALARPHLWAALWSVDPTRVPDRDAGCPAWLSSGEISRRRAKAFIERLRLARWESGEPGDRVYVDRGLDHVGTASAAYEDDRIYAWLYAHRRRSDGV